METALINVDEFLLDIAQASTTNHFCNEVPTTATTIRLTNPSDKKRLPAISPSSFPCHIVRIVCDETCSTIESIADGCFWKRADACVDSTSQLRTVDLSAAMTKVSVIPPNFMRGCDTVETLNLGSMKKVKRISDNILMDCVSLVNIVGMMKREEERGDTEQHKKVQFDRLQKVGSNFMRNCTAVTRLDFSTAAQLKEIGDNFCNDCRGLSTVVFRPIADHGGHTKLTKIGDSFLYNCSQLKAVDLTGFSSLAVPRDDDANAIGVGVLGSYFMFDCVRCRVVAPAKLVEVIDVHPSVKASMMWVPWSWQMMMPTTEARDDPHYPLQVAVCGVFQGVVFEDSSSSLESRADDGDHNSTPRNEPDDKKMMEPTPKRSVRRNLPSEVAYEICTYLDSGMRCLVLL